MSCSLTILDVGFESVYLIDWSLSLSKSLNSFIRTSAVIGSSPDEACRSIILWVSSSSNGITI